MNNSQLTSVSHCGQYMACVTNDGQVHFWDTGSSNLLSRFSFHRHSSNLSLLCVNIRWLHNSNTSVQDELHNDEPPKKKSKRETTLHPTRTEKLAAVGTSDGTIWIFNFIKQTLHTQLSPLTGRGALLNFDYEPTKQSFFLLFSKSYLAQINFAGNELKSFELDRNDYKFSKNDSKPIVNVVDDNTLLIGKNLLALIDWEELNIVRTFTGNNSRITVCAVQSPVNFPNKYFLFIGTEGERMITIYDMQNPNEQYAFLNVDDTPTSLQVHITADKRLLAFVITASGKLFVFQEDIRDVQKKNKDRIFKHKWLLMISEEPKIDFGFVRFIQAFEETEGLAGSIVYGYGNALNPDFDTLTLRGIKKTYFDKRGIIKAIRQRKDKKKDAQDSKEKGNKKDKSDDVAAEEKSLTIVQENVHKSKFDSGKQNSKAVQVLGPALPNCNPLAAFEKEPKTRKEPKSPKEMTLEMRLKLEERGLKNFLKDQEEEEEQEEKRKYRERMHGVSDKLVTALEQGLQNDNTEMLMTALLCPDEKTIENTVIAMKYQTIVPLINKLQVLIHSCDGNQDAYYNWLSIITKMKLSYFLQLPDKQKLFKPLIKFLEFKRDSFYKMSVLHGRLQVMMDTMKELNKPVKEALIHYESDSSDEEMEMELEMESS